METTKRENWGKTVRVATGTFDELESLRQELAKTSVGKVSLADTVAHLLKQAR